MATLFQSFFGFLGRKDRWPSQGAMTRQPGLESDRIGWILLSEAARRMYDELGGTLWRTAADREDSPDARRDFLALHLARNAPIEGRPPPSRSYRPIPPSEFDTGVFKGGGKYFQRDYESYLAFLDMRVREEDLRDVIEKMKTGQ